MPGTSVRKQPIFRDVTTGFGAKWRLRNERRKFHTDDVSLPGSALFVVLFIGWYTNSPFRRKTDGSARNVDCFLRLERDQFLGRRRCYRDVRFIRESMKYCVTFDYQPGLLIVDSLWAGFFAGERAMKKQREPVSNRPPSACNSAWL